MIEQICVARAGLKACIRVVLMCCNDMAYELTIEYGGRSYRCLAVYDDNLSRDCIVCETDIDSIIDRETLDDMLTEAFAIFDARMAMGKYK